MKARLSPKDASTNTGGPGYSPKATPAQISKLMAMLRDKGYFEFRFRVDDRDEYREACEDEAISFAKRHGFSIIVLEDLTQREIGFLYSKLS